MDTLKNLTAGTTGIILTQATASDIKDILSLLITLSTIIANVYIAVRNKRKKQKEN